MKIAVGQMEVHPGRPQLNLKAALKMVRQAVEQGCDMLTLPEMALPGYLLGDLWERESFLRECLEAQDELVRASVALPIAFGGLAVDWKKHNEDGRVRKYNAACLAQRGDLLRPGKTAPYAIKTLLPNYREFDDSRHFYDTRKLAQEQGVTVESLIQPFTLKVAGKSRRLGLMLCEDGWDQDYGLSPAQILVRAGSEMLFNLSCSPYTRGKNSKRGRVFSAQARALGTPLVYCNCVGLQNNGKTIYSFDGSSNVYDGQGKTVYAAPMFETALGVVDMGAPPRETCGVETSDIVEMYRALIYGTSNFLKLTGIERVVIGLSGGIDSALAAVLYARLLPPENLLLVNMPSRFNSGLTRQAAETLATRLGCGRLVLPIGPGVEATLGQFENLDFKVGEKSHRLSLSPLGLENVQARDRGARLLAALASAFGGGFTCNANKSELTVGYATLYGDLAGFAAVLGDLWKGDVYGMSRYINQNFGDLIPAAILEVKPSAELSEAQNPEKGGGDPLCYPYHDALFRCWVEDWNRKSPEEVLQWYEEGSLAEHLGVDPTLVEGLFANIGEFIQDLERWWKAYAGLGLAKRIQAPPILALTRRAFGFDHRESQLPVTFTKNYLERKTRLLRDGGS